MTKRFTPQVLHDSDDFSDHLSKPAKMHPSATGEYVLFEEHHNTVIIYNKTLKNYKTVMKENATLKSDIDLLKQRIAELEK